MLSKIKVVVLGLLVLVSVSCTSEAESSSDTLKYFDLKGLINQQIELLSENKPTIKKVFILDGKEEVVETQHMNWEDEFELFLQADINRPAFATSYSTILNDSIVRYELIPTEKLPVKFLQIYTDSLSGLHIEANVKSENKLYVSEKVVKMYLAKEDGRLKVNHYSVEGSQKLILMDPTTFRIEGSILKY